jgi:hypothetical protein
LFRSLAVTLTPLMRDGLDMALPDETIEDKTLSADPTP